jgi:hypothetical protein
VFVARKAKGCTAVHLAGDADFFFAGHGHGLIVSGALHRWCDDE